MKPKVLLSVFFLFIAAAFHAQKIDQNFFEKADIFFSTHVNNGLLDYSKLKNNEDLAYLIDQIGNSTVEGQDENIQKAFYINAYNLLVINEVLKIYPTGSVQEKGGFFDRNKILIEGKRMTLTNFEKQKILKPFNDPRLHFVLVCGALGCPPITDFAYTPDALDTQIQKQTDLSLNNPKFIKEEDGNILLSEIFKWYASDFGGSKKEIINYINDFREQNLDQDAPVDYYSYDWSLNQVKKQVSAAELLARVNANRYIVSSTIPKGTFELKIFNNLYSQRTGSSESLTDRSTFFTTSTSFLYGVNNRFNAGLVMRYRRVRNSGIPSSPFDVFQGIQSGISRQGITALGPQIRYAPVPRWQNFSIQSNLAFPIGQDLSGSNTGQPWIDWSTVSWTTQFFNDRAIGNYFSLFTEVAIIWEGIGSSNWFSVPATAILSYTPTRKTTFYALTGFAPIAQIPFQFFTQAGVGGKYQFTPKVELELLYTLFTSQQLIDNDGDAQTINMGFRFNF